jgi:hypothetical protein
MNLSKRILIGWLLGVVTMAVSLLLPHEGVSTASFASNSILLLLFLFCLQISRRDPTKSNKAIFANFTAFFGVALLFHASSIVGKAFTWTDPFVTLYLHQYIHLGFYLFLLTLAIVYLSIDVLFRDFKIPYKYLLAFAITAGFFVYYYHPLLLNPKYVYTTAEIQDWKVLDRAFSQYVATQGVEPEPRLLAQNVELSAWKGDTPVGVLNQDAKIARVNELYPYLFGSNYKILLYRPLYMNTVHMCIVSIGFILLFFGYQYAKDPPQGAYIDKIMFLFLIFCSSELLHAWSFAKSVEWETFSQILRAGEYVSIGVLLFMVVAFHARLRFIVSPKGEFYEQEIATNAAGVTRWRDALDDLFLAYFFNRKAIVGRMFADPSRER